MPSNTSNNNLFYAGTPSATNLIYADGTSTAQTIGAYRGGVFTAEQFHQEIHFQYPSYRTSTVRPAPAQASLHNPAVPTQVESGGTPIAGITDDFDGNARNVSTPDIGADEFAGIILDLTPPFISYTTLGNGSASGHTQLYQCGSHRSKRRERHPGNTPTGLLQEINRYQLT